MIKVREKDAEIQFVDHKQQAVVRFQTLSIESMAFVALLNGLPISYGHFER